MSPLPHTQLADVIVVSPADVIISVAGRRGHPESLGTTIWIWRQAPREPFCLSALLPFRLSAFVSFCQMSQPQPPHTPNFPPPPAFRGPKPGDRGYRVHAAVPRPMVMDFKHRPESKLSAEMAQQRRPPKEGRRYEVGKGGKGGRWSGGVVGMGEAEEEVVLFLYSGCGME